MNNGSRLVTLVIALVVGLVSEQGCLAQDLGDTVSEPGVFSYKPPKGWTASSSSDSKYKFSDPSDASIDVVIGKNSDPLPAYVDQVKTGFLHMNFDFVEVKPFETTAGVKGSCLVITHGTSAFFYYMFAAGDSKISIFGLCDLDKKDTYEPIFAASAKTLTLP